MTSFIEKKLAEHGIDAKTGKKNNRLKKSKVQKYEDVYRIPMAYVGLLELDTRERAGDFDRDYRGRLPFETAVGEGYIWMWMKIRAEDSAPHSYYDPKAEEMYNRFKADPTDVEAETYYQNYKLREENAMDYLEIKVFGKFGYVINTPKGERHPFEAGSGYFPDVESFIAWAEQKSQEGWSEVTIKVNDMAIEMAEFFEAEASLPSEITIDTGTEVGSIRFKIGHDSELIEDGYVNEETVIALEEGIELDLHAVIRPVKDEDSWNRYGSSYDIQQRRFKPLSYNVKCVGEITDTNTQVSSTRNKPEMDSWKRDFGYQGALELEDAKQILASNIRELVEEWRAYVESNRVYEEHGHGVGYARTKDQMTPWDYNFGDTREDIDYDTFQNREMESRVLNEIRSIVDLDYGWGSSNGALSLRYEGVKPQEDGTFIIEGRLEASGRYVNEKDLKEDMINNHDDYLKRVFEAFKTNLRMKNYEIVSEDLQPAGDTYLFTIVVRPTVAKSRNMVKSIRMKFKAMKSAKRI